MAIASVIERNTQNYNNDGDQRDCHDYYFHVHILFGLRSLLSPLLCRGAWS